MGVHELLPEVGHFTDQKHRHIAEIIAEYDPALSLIFVPLDKRELDEEFPFAILHDPGNREPYVVRYVRESDMDERLLAWIKCSDDNDLNAKLDAEEWARKTMQEKQHREKMDAQLDFTKSVLDGKNYYRHNGRTYS